MDFFNNMTELFIKIMTGIMYVAPIGVFCLMADATGTFGYSVLMKILYLIVLYIIVLALITYGMIGGSVAMFSKCTTYKKFFQSMWKVQLFAFSTASSMATLPLNMNTTITELGVSKETTSFALPLGATINMDGTAIYQGVCAIFIASCYGIHLTLPQMLTMILTATLASIGTAGVPGAGMVMLAMVLASVGLPVDGIALVAGVDRIFDMGRTVVNITGDASCSIIVSNMERKKDAKREIANGL